jgi:hypothetical protein
MELLRVPVMLPGSFGAWKALTVIALGVLAGLGKLFDLRDTISVLLPPLAAHLRRPADPPVAARWHDVTPDPQLTTHWDACDGRQEQGVQAGADRQ